jgi:hypothetical protein
MLFSIFMTLFLRQFSWKQLKIEVRFRPKIKKIGKNKLIEIFVSKIDIFYYSQFRTNKETEH